MTTQPLGSEGLVEAVARIVNPGEWRGEQPNAWGRQSSLIKARQIDGLYAARLEASEARARKLEAERAEAEAEAEHIAEADSLRDRAIERTVRAQSAEAQLAQALAREGRLRGALESTATNLRRLSAHLSDYGLPGLARATREGAEDAEAALSEPPVKPEGQTGPSVARAEVAASSGVKSDSAEGH